jgi:hypothetical protein
MSKAASSFFDWELEIRGNKQGPTKKENQEENKAQTQKDGAETSLGISKKEFKTYVTEWKKKNL